MGVPYRFAQKRGFVFVQKGEIKLFSKNADKTAPKNVIMG